MIKLLDSAQSEKRTPNVTRQKMRKSIWCEGCGLGNVEGMIVRSLFKVVAERVGADVNTKEGLERVKNNVAFVSGIGCTSRMPGHLDFNTLHTTHGRSLSFATGLKMARPDLTVVVVAGDGDIFAIGGNHFIHTARRNIDLTLVVYDNQSYGMTGAQHSPTSPIGEFGTSAPYGVYEPPFNLAKLAVGAGASFVAQGAITMYRKNLDQLEALIEQGIRHRGFSFINALGYCHTGWGNKNKRGDAYRCRKVIAGRVASFEKWKGLSEIEKNRVFPLGILQRDERADLQKSRSFSDVVAKAKALHNGSRDSFEPVSLKKAEPLTVHPRTSIRFAGSGGHGVISAGEIALEAVVASGLNGVFTKNYGPEARGGEAYSDVVVSEGDVHFPQPVTLDLLVALNQETFNKFKNNVSQNGKILIDSSTVKNPNGDPRVIASPIKELFVHQVSSRAKVGINVLALGVAFGYLGIVPRETLENVVMKKVGKKNPELNKRALDAGFREAKRLRGE